MIGGMRSTRINADASTAHQQTAAEHAQHTEPDQPDRRSSTSCRWRRSRRYWPGSTGRGGARVAALLIAAVGKAYGDVREALEPPQRALHPRTTTSTSALPPPAPPRALPSCAICGARPSPCWAPTPAAASCMRTITAPGASSGLRDFTFTSGNVVEQKPNTNTNTNSGNVTSNNTGMAAIGTPAGKGTGSSSEKWGSITIPGAGTHPSTAIISAKRRARHTITMTMCSARATTTYTPPRPRAPGSGAVMGQQQPV